MLRWLRQSKIVVKNCTRMLRRLFSKTIIIYIYQNQKKLNQQLETPIKSMNKYKAMIKDTARL